MQVLQWLFKVANDQKQADLSNQVREPSKEVLVSYKRKRDVNKVRKPEETSLDYKKQHCRQSDQKKDRSNKGDGNKNKTISRMKELLRWAAAAKSEKGGKFGKKVMHFRNKSATVKSGDFDDEITNESPKISIAWEVQSCSTTCSAASAPPSIKYDECARKTGSWITTDDEYHIGDQIPLDKFDVIKSMKNIENVVVSINSNIEKMLALFTSNEIRKNDNGLFKTREDIEEKDFTSGTLMVGDLNNRSSEKNLIYGNHPKLGRIFEECVNFDVDIQKTPLQPNGTDCGMYILKYVAAENKSDWSKIFYTTAFMGIERLKYLAKLITSEFNEATLFKRAILGDASIDLKQLS
uniref:Uncharacterized protein n=1 Tax=Chenopodium quinoa TaxID=63459 RepID=A0A803LAI8_CHEQI